MATALAGWRAPARRRNTRGVSRPPRSLRWRFSPAKVVRL